jgi:hypothetical protein
MARRRREVEVFTMSSLNMLSKALGAVILLFIIIPKVTVKDKARLKRLPPELDMIICDSNSLKVMRGDSVLIMNKFDSIAKDYKSQIAAYDSLLRKLQCIKEHITINPPPPPPHPPVPPDPHPPVPPDPPVVECDNDTQAPSISGCPKDITVTADANKNCTTAGWTTPTAIDNCGPATLTVSSSPTKDLSAYKCFPVGVTTVSYTATDRKGNSNQCAFTVTVDKKGGGGSGNGSGEVDNTPTDIPFPTRDPVTIYVEWSGDKDVKIELSAKNTATGGCSGWCNFNSSMPWMTYHNDRKGAFKYFTQNPLKGDGNYEIYAVISRGKSAKVKGVAVLKDADGKKLISKDKIEKEIGVDKKGVLIGTVHVTSNSITFK